jgi:hypothetical protein
MGSLVPLSQMTVVVEILRSWWASQEGASVDEKLPVLDVLPAQLQHAVIRVFRAARAHPRGLTVGDFR